MSIYLLLVVIKIASTHELVTTAFTFQSPNECEFTREKITKEIVSRGDYEYLKVVCIEEKI